MACEAVRHRLALAPLAAKGPAAGLARGPGSPPAGVGGAPASACGPPATWALPPALVAHMARCPACQAEVAAWAALDQALGHLAEPAPDLAGAVLRALETWRPQGGGRDGSATRAALAACLVAVAVAGGTGLAAVMVAPVQVGQALAGAAAMAAGALWVGRLALKVVGALAGVVLAVAANPAALAGVLAVPPLVAVAGSRWARRRAGGVAP